MTLRRLLVLYLVKAAWEEFQVFQDDTWSNRNLATIVEEAQLATNKGVFQFLIELLTEVELHVANIIAIVHHGVDAIRHHQAHLRLAWRAQGGIEKTLASLRETEILDAIQCPKMTEIHLISHLCRLRILARDDVIGDLTVEIAKLGELVLSHLRTELRIDIVHQLWL